MKWIALFLVLLSGPSLGATFKFHVFQPGGAAEAYDLNNEQQSINLPRSPWSCLALKLRQKTKTGLEGAEIVCRDGTKHLISVSIQCGKSYKDTVLNLWKMSKMPSIQYAILLTCNSKA